MRKILILIDKHDYDNNSYDGHNANKKGEKKKKGKERKGSVILPLDNRKICRIKKVFS